LFDNDASVLYTLTMSEISKDDPNPWGFLKSFQQGKSLLEQLENELVYLVNDLMNFQDELSETSVSALKYTIAKTEEAIQRVEIEIKMFEEQ